MSQWHRGRAAMRRSPDGGARSTVWAYVALTGLLLLAALLLDGTSVRGAQPTPRGTPDLATTSIPVRIRIDSLGIDLPVLSSKTKVRDNTPGYPLCDVAQYWTLYDLPGAPGTTWIFAHARPGMFLPLQEVAEATDGEGLLDTSVSLQLADGRLLTYRIDTVTQHAVNRRIARDRGRREQRLVLQTSEGPPGTIPKLQLSGQLIDAAWTSEVAPQARPRACGTPAQTRGPSGGPTGGPSASPAADASASPRPLMLGPVRLADANLTFEQLASTVVGAVVVLLGAALVAWWLITRKR